MRGRRETALVAYDLLILRREARAAFSGASDLLLLVLLVPVGLLFAWNAVGPLLAEAGGMPLVAKGALIGLSGFGVAYSIANRLRHLRTKTMVARHALQPIPAAVHCGFWSAPPLLGALAVFIGARGPVFELGALLAAYGFGAAAALGWRALWRRLRHFIARRRGTAALNLVPGLKEGTRRQRIVRLLLARSWLRRTPAAVTLALFAAFGAVLGFLVRLRDQAVPAFLLAFAGFAAVLLVGYAMRQHPPLLRYLLFLGVMPTAPALVPLLPVAALCAGFVGAAWSSGAIPVARLAGGAAALLMFLAVTALLRAYHYAAKSRQAAQFAIQMELLILAAAVFIAPPVAPFLLAFRLWTLRRAAAALRHSAP